MRYRLHIVATCCDKKTIPPSPQLRMRAVEAGPIEKRAEAWKRAIGFALAGAPVCPAEKLYAGTYWADVRRLLAVAEEHNYLADLWIASAGLGLLPGNAIVPSYSATFATRHEDSIATGIAERDEAITLHQRWWKELGIKSPIKRLVSTVAGLCAEFRRDSVLVLGSPDYVNALALDLERAREELNSPGRLVIVTSPGRIRSELLVDSVAEDDARLVHDVGGSVLSLHARAARTIVEDAKGRPLSALDVRKRLQARLEACPKFEWPSRREMTDEDVRQFISRRLRADKSCRPTRLLRVLRDGGCACEQKRFKGLFGEVVGTIA